MLNLFLRAFVKQINFGHVYILGDNCLVLHILFDNAIYKAT